MQATKENNTKAMYYIGFFYFNHVKNKHQVEKELIRKKQELEIQRKTMKCQMMIATEILSSALVPLIQAYSDDVYELPRQEESVVTTETSGQ